MFLLVGLALLTARCELPDFSKEPSISFKELKRIPVLSTEYDRPVYVDSMIIRIDFKDGDGNLGLSPGDTSGPFDKKSPFHNNYKLTYYKKVGKDFVLVNLPNSAGLNLNPVYSRFPVLRTDGKEGPIEGTLDLSFIIDYPAENVFDPDLRLPYPGDTLQFRVQIWDRSLNVSNEVTSSEVVILKGK